MVDTARPVFILSNDIVPNLAMPVAAPGLRAFGLAQGLRANGFKVKTLVPRGFVDRQWLRFGSSVPHPAAPDVEAVNAKRLARYLGSNAPAVAVLINSNQVEHLRPVEGVRYVLDFFAPKMLETLYQHGEGHPRDELADLRRRKIRAIELADAFIVNGAKKVPYFLAWMLQVDRDVRRLPLEVVNMCVPLAWSEEIRGEGPVRFAVAGYLQSWSTLGGWVKVVERQLERPEMSLDLLVPWHWGGRSRERSHVSKSDLDRLAQHESVTTHGSMTFSAFQRFLSTVDISIDLFHHNLEREYAMVTRSITCLACGVPVIHPPFTEVSPMIAEYDAGWLVDPEDTAALENVIDGILGDPDHVRQKKKNARALAREIIDPAVAVKPLARIMESL